MDTINLIKTILAFIGTGLLFLLPYVTRENKRLNNEAKDKDNLLNTVKENEKIKSDNSKLSKSDLINGLSD